MVEKSERYATERRSYMVTENESGEKKKKRHKKAKVTIEKYIFRNAN